MTLFKELTPAIHDHGKKIMELIREEIKRIEDTHDIMPLVEMFKDISEAYYKGKGELVLIKSELDIPYPTLPKWKAMNKDICFSTLEKALKHIFKETGRRNFRIKEDKVYLLND